MKQKRKFRLLLYIFIVIIPAIGSTIYYFFQEYKHEKEQVQELAEYWASIHGSYWNLFINNTVVSLQTLALSAETVFPELEKMKPLLKEMEWKDPRYEAIFIFDPLGEMITGSNDNYGSGEIFEAKSLVKNVAKTKDTMTSSRPFLLQNGHRVTGLAYPMLNKQMEPSFIIVALLRIDYIENIMKMLTPESKVYIVNEYNQTILKLGMDEKNSLDSTNWFSVPIDILPWTVNIEVPGLDLKKISLKTATPIIIILFFTHIIYAISIFIAYKKQKEKEEKEIEAQKLELIGSMAAVTAHEIRNPLTGIKGLVQLLKEKYNDETDQVYFSIINDEIERINQIVGEFLVLGKPSASKMQKEDLAQILSEVEPLISSEAKYNQIECETSIPEGEFIVECVKDQMKQVILNIAKNAFDSMEKGGKLTISLAKRKNSIELEITDTGIGIKKEDLEKIFKPFYTSKEKGTGLGLVVCQRIIHSFNGDIFISSKENLGTTVKIVLPHAVG